MEQNHLLWFIISLTENVIWRTKKTVAWAPKWRHLWMLDLVWLPSSWSRQGLVEEGPDWQCAQGSREVDTLADHEECSLHFLPTDCVNNDPVPFTIDF